MIVRNLCGFLLADGKLPLVLCLTSVGGQEVWRGHESWPLVACDPPLHRLPTPALAVVIAAAAVTVARVSLE